MAATMMRSIVSSQSIGAIRPTCPITANPLPVRRACVVMRADGDGRGSQVADKVAEGVDKVSNAAQRAGDKASDAVDNAGSPGTSPLAETPFAKAVRGAESNQREQWEKPSPPENQTPGVIFPAFTRNREINAGRLAMIGFSAAYIGEIITPNHLGIIGQVSAWSGVSTGAIGATFVGLIVANLLGGVLPFSATFDENVQKDNAKRNAGPIQGNLGGSPKGFFNITDLGFTKQNELFNGRMAQLGFLAALTGEVASGHGPIGQVAQYLNVPVDDELFASAKVLLGLWTLFLLGSAAVTGNWGQKVPGDDRVY